MADLSLDAYIAKNNAGNRSMRGGLANRLGNKVRGGGGGGRGRGGGPARRGRGGGQHNSGTQFNVVGLAKVNQGFDARQKLSNNPLKTTVQDARQKIRPKTFDARQAIGKKQQNVDVRSKIESIKARKGDARQKINIARQAKTPPAEQHVTVTGGVRKMTTGVPPMSLTKTIKTEPVAPKPLAPLTRTVNNKQSMIPLVPQALTRTTTQRAPPQRMPVMRSSPAPTSNLVITKKNPSVARAPLQLAQQQMSRGTGVSLRGIRSHSSEQWSGTESTLRSAAGTGTVVSVKNEMYDPRHPDEDDEEDMSYSHPIPVRQTTSQSIPAGTVWEAIQAGNAKRTPETHVPVTDTVSPLQGYRVLVTNLHPIVSQDDIMELFSAVGSLKKARLIKPGTAEAIFVTKEEALAAVKKYHMRELDGLPMQLVLTSRGGGPETVAPASSQRPITTQSNPPQPSTPESKGPLRLGQLSQSNSKQAVGSVEPGLIHKALFKTPSRDDTPARPVTFTVKI